MINPQTDDKTFAEIMEVLIGEGLEGLPRVVELLLNMAMRLERSRALGAGPYERTPDRSGYANGYKPKRVKSRVGALDLRMPQVRDGVSLYPGCLERGMRSDRALVTAMAEMYVTGVSTRRSLGCWRSFAVSRSALRRLAGRRLCWTRSWKPGGAVLSGSVRGWYLMRRITRCGETEC